MDLEIPGYQNYMAHGFVNHNSKADMARRGVKSPDFADALALAFADFGTGPWEMGRDEANRSLLADVPPGVFLEG